MTGNFKQEVLKYLDEFAVFGKKYVNLDSERNLSYRNEKTYSVVCISEAYDIKEMEAQTFLEKVDAKVCDTLKPDILEEELRRPSVVQDYIGSMTKDKGKLG